MRQRARQSCAENIRRGHVRWEGPGGLVRSHDHRIAKSADRQVQHAIAGVFRPFHVLGSARQTTVWSRDAPLPLRAVQPGTAGRAILWRLPSGPRIKQMLTHPCSAGALASGRTEAQTVLEDGRARQSPRRQKPRAPWRLLRLDPHPGSIRWEAFVQNQQTLAANRHTPEEAVGGAAKRGPALLRGVLRCGRCGRKLQVA